MTEPSLTITRVFDAPPALLYDVWTDPAHLAKWWGPKDFHASSIDLDATEGGKWRHCMVSPDGREHWSHGEFRVLQPPEKLAFTFTWEAEDALATLVTIDFEDQDGKTLMTFRQGPFADESTRDDHRDGWLEAFDDITAHVSSVHSG
ncbi:SRPBCC family protein [Actinokineospora iranica]|uniref:Uncharacterized conserved protein YndB, AHSA1/START domain n=1 Tax=Actinokineospora iranica TaxID=1271860 RepID=A0A1G6R2X3_9PSEU|nr:SRPBCC domain-containing protein [Actinokineospora iranica]SDC98594.1 Uncharacterized conserved protein YndB, AHSA1/START domain [Actinokineospora iranica]